MRRRGFGIALALLIACRGRTEPDIAPSPPAPRDALAARPDASDLRAYLDHLAPRGQPAAPLVRRYRQGDCRTEYAPRPERDPSPMCRVTGGTFTMGGRLPAGRGVFSSSSEPVAATVGDFDIDQFPVTAQQAALFLDAHGNACPDARGPTYEGRGDCVLAGARYSDELELRDGRFVATPGREHAAVWFSYEGALRYCAWVGKQVPSSAQWEYAARHDPRTNRDLAFAWGDTWDLRRVSCYADACPGNASLREERVVGLYDGTSPRGDGTSPWGVHDMMYLIDQLMFACRDPNETCHAGAACSCKVLSSTRMNVDTDALASFAREDAARAAIIGLRCARRR